MSCIHKCVYTKIQLSACAAKIKRGKTKKDTSCSSTAPGVRCYIKMIPISEGIKNIK